ncbi:DNRLRE domain-containing protein [Clostridium grantii]|uniref:RHS repeat-associated core domain-containing protein n=1 Tax=Clostridium grantii DSM 8605 TaxID=1121316 RepID=A0A1M5RQW9_9CLOT|nr:DNRLRE domain-containing protein [Clostridium grantii]SHH28624.1 RHS repeat-associated core domain-containing protein [Clostridium grantii DSM 8605]
MKNIKNNLAIILLSIFLCNILPVTVLAQNLNKDYVEPQFSSAETNASKKDAKIIKEVTEKRERNVKHFFMENNTYQAVIYPYSVHYDNNGKWEEVDNSLVETTDEDNNSVLQNKSNSYKVKFGKTIDSNKLVSIKKDKYEVYWNLINDSNESEANSQNEINTSETSSDVESITENSEETTTESTTESTTENITENNEEINTENTPTVDQQVSEINETSQPNTNEQEVLNESIEPNANEEQQTEDMTEGTTEPENNSGIEENSEIEDNNLVQEEKTNKASDKKENPKFYDNLNKNSQIEIVAKDLGKLNNLSENEKKRAVTKAESNVIFKNIYNNIDLTYNVEPDKFKETIVINEKTSNPEFRFNLYAKNLIAQINEDKSISFYDSKDKQNIIFVIDAPFMYDSNGEESKDIDIKLEENEKGYELIITPSNEWVNSEDRVYPIYVDPTLTTSLDVNDIYDAHVSQNYAGTNYQTSAILKTGYGSTSGINRSYMSFQLPTELTTADLITDAELVLWLNNDASTTRQVDLHRVTGSWSSSTITWNNKAAYDSKIEDYQLVNGTAGQYFSWDVTAMVKEWHSTGTNYGYMLKNHDESTGYTEYRSSDTTIPEARPQIVISYVNNSGLEDYWTYHSQTVGRAGTGFVNDYNGNLIFTHNDLSMNGNLMPVAINHVFNSNDRDTDIKYGLGWRLNLSQTIKWEMIEGVEYYVYTDEDGTKHYLKRNEAENNYEDESGLNISLTYHSESTNERYRIKDKGDNEITFTSAAQLYRIYDNNGNYIQLNYTSGALTSVVDGAGRTTTLTRNGDGSLKEIVDPSNRKTTFGYTSSKLTSITYPDTKVTNFYYDSNNNLTETKNYDGYRMTYSYYTVKPYRVKKIAESNIDGTLGQELNIDYGYNTTVFTDYTGEKNIYQFNDAGNTISIRDDAGNAQYYKYDNTGFNNNKLSNQSKLQRSVMNYVKNHNVEAAGDWTVGYWTGSTGSGAISTTHSYSGKQSLMINKTNTSSRHFYQQIMYPDKGKTYTLSAYVETENISSGKGAALFVNYQDSTGAWKTIESNYISGTNDWQRLQVTFDLPADALTGAVYARLGVIEETGIAYFDAIQLEEGTVANRYNLLENPNLIYGTTTPTFWNKNAATDSGDTLVTSSDSTYPTKLDSQKKVFKINGNSGLSKNVYQTLNMSGKAGDVFVVAGWAKGDSVKLSAGRYFAMDVGIEKNDGTWQWEVVTFNQDSNDWQYVADRIVADADYKSIKFYCLYYKNENTAYFDGLQLYKEEFGQSYVYDADGNLTSVSDLAKENSTFEYNTNNDLVKATNASGNNFNYNYDDNHNILDATSAENIVYSFTYDSNGNPLTSKIGNDTLFIKSTATYTANKNYIDTLTDSSGNTVDYNYNETKGTLDNVVDAKGNTTSYGYDPNLDRLDSVSKTVDGQVITNSYGYKNDELETITHNGFNYKFEYDSLGNNTYVKVGTQNLIQNIYEARTSKFLKSIYGNGDYKEPVYDDEDRVIGEKYNGVEEFKYQYYADGNLGYHEDLVNGINYKYIYDLSGRLGKVVESDGNSVKYDYDIEDNISNIAENINGASYSTTYLYDKDSKLKNIAYAGNNLGFNYDILGRLTSKTINTGTAIFVTGYAYEAGTVANSTTTRVSTITNNGNGITYTYDANGNIETITENSKEIKYTYNELNELKREDNQVLNKTIVYTYDVGGNLTSKKEYPYTTGTPGTATKTYSYTYGEANWKDKLTNFDGNAITYDAIGNPLTYDNWVFDWEHGRQLKSMNGNGYTISYKYNNEGIRTEKTINGVTTKYHLQGDKVTFESNGTDSIYYTYDSGDNLVSMNLNGVEYYYIRNTQRDIIGLFDKNGATVVQYTYDSWGKLVSTTGSLASTVGAKNPYRYRGYRYDTETALYYLQSRYYNPSWGRFINADAIAGNIGILLSHNVFAYCVNAPVNQSDEGGFIAPAIVYAAYIYATAVAASPDTQLDLQLVSMDLAKGDYISAALDLIGILIPGGTGFGQLSKPGQKLIGKLLRGVFKPLQMHHFATNKNKLFTPQFKKIVGKYGLNLNGDWNKALMPHQGRHTNAYHNYILKEIKRIHSIAKGDKTKFLKLFNRLKQDVINDPNILYKK